MIDVRQGVLEAMGKFPPVIGRGRVYGVGAKFDAERFLADLNSEIKAAIDDAAAINAPEIAAIEKAEREAAAAEAVVADTEAGNPPAGATGAVPEPADVETEESEPPRLE
jgi:hypothetical protein